MGPAGECEGAGVKQIHNERCIISISRLLSEGKRTAGLSAAVQGFDEFRQ